MKHRELRKCSFSTGRIQHHGTITWTIVKDTPKAFFLILNNFDILFLSVLAYKKCNVFAYQISTKFAKVW